MSRKFLATTVLTVALALTASTAAFAQDEEMESSFDPAAVPEFNQDEALIAYQALESKLIAMGVAGEDVSAAIEYLATTYGNLSEADMDELLAGSMLADSEAEMGDDEFGDSEEEEPELGDDEMGDADDEDEDDDEDDDE